MAERTPAVEVRAPSAETDSADATVTFEGVQDLSFDRRVRGVIAWSVDEEEAIPPKWDVVVRERGTRARTVELEGVGF